jgi:Na+/proline symporter
MLSARNEAGAVKATLFFNLAHYAIRPWPWILVALASLVIFPDVAALQTAFPNIATNLINDDLAYPAMLSLLPEGLAGLLLASLTAAFMSTISTQTNWGASYLVADVYKRAINPEATDKQQVQAGRIVSVVLILLAALLAPLLQSALSGFSILLQIGAGTGLIFILRWFWWRINAWTELSGMAISFAIAIFFELVWPQIASAEAAFSTTEKLLWGTGLTTIGWLLVTLLTKPEPRTTLYRFCKKTQPGGPGWHKVTSELKAQGEKITANWQVPKGVAAMVAASIFIYSLLFGTGMLLYRDWLWLGIWLLVALAAGGVLRYLWGRLSIE